MEKLEEGKIIDMFYVIIYFNVMYNNIFKVCILLNKYVMKKKK